MVIKHGTADCGFFVLCWNAAILSFYFILTKFQIKGNYLLGHCLVPVSLKVSFQSTCDLLILMCKVSNRSSMLCFTKGRILSTTWRTSTVKKTCWRKFVRSVPRNLNAFLREFLRMRVEWCNVMPIFTFICKLDRDIFGSDHALLLQSFLFQNAISHMFYSNFPSFTP